MIKQQRGKTLTIYTHSQDPYFEGETIQHKETLKNTYDNGLYAKMIVSRARCRGDRAAFWRVD